MPPTLGAPASIKMAAASKDEATYVYTYIYIYIYRDTEI